MGFGGISIWQLLIILVIVVLIFGTKKLRGMGGDLGSAIKSFKKAVKEDDSAKGADGEKPALETSEAAPENPDAASTVEKTSTDEKKNA